MSKKQKNMLIRIIITIIIIIILNFFSFNTIPNLLVYLVTYFIIGYDILKKAIKGTFNRQVFNEYFLMTIATIGAFTLAICNQSEDYNEAIAVMLLYQIGELFQSYAVGRSRKNITNLMDIRPDYANIEKDGNLFKVNPNEVSIGDIIIVQPGEKIPLDGIIIEGESALNTSALTGESIPCDVKENDEVLSGCINMNGVLKIKTTKGFEECTVSKILELIENATSTKSKSEDFITKFAKFYTPFVCYSALILAIFPPIIEIILIKVTPDWTTWIYRALTFLVISCPCALVISVPLSFFAGIGGASKEGILIKGSNFIEMLAKAKYVVLDKTGTLTQGVFEVTSIHHTSINQEKLLEYATLAECASSHPISKSLQKAYEKPIDRNRVKDIEEISGHGIIAKVDGISVIAGNSKLMKKFNINHKECSSFGTIIHIAIDGEYAGHIVISDITKPSSKEAIKSLKKIGIKKIIMLTGDTEKVAQKVALQLEIDEVYSDLLPMEKVLKLKALTEYKSNNEKIIFAGDGINDAPVLTQADVGIAMGAMGSDAAIEAADVVLMDDDPIKIAKAIKISKKCINIVWQNIIFAILVKFGCLGLGALGIVNMWFAIFADVGVTVIAILNAIRALKANNL